MNQRHKWFLPASAPYSVLWWVPQGERPTLDGALVRLKHLREQGPSAFAFDWANLLENVFGNLMARRRSADDPRCPVSFLCYI